MTSASFVHLRRDGVSLLFALPDDGAPDAGLPTVLHWGADLGDLDSAALADLVRAESAQTAPGTVDATWQPSVLPQESEGWSGRPGAQLTRGGAPVFPRWSIADATATDDELRLDALDEAAGIRLTSILRIEAGGIVTVRHAVADAGGGGLAVDWVEATLPVPRRADRSTDFSGRWTREKSPQTVPMPRGAHQRQTRRGRTGHDSPTLLMASIGEPADRQGDIWGVHLGWSADGTWRTDRMPDAATLLGAGELLRAGEVVLAAGETYESPVSYFAWSGAGLDGISERFHTYLRSRPQHPSSPRPLVLNTWEAVYFDHDPAFLSELAGIAAGVGVERFVLDDGWFMARRDDTKGLGDWEVDPAVWPDGLGPLAARVHELGMQFGLWFEPEMVNLDSDLARAHPDWLLHNPAHLDHAPHLSWRTQFVLDIAKPGAYAHVLEQMSALVGDLGIDFIKWDHNRDLIESVHDGRHGVHAQTLAVYRLIAELKSRHPQLEIESCSSGGARTDLGILQLTDRVWASDSNDPVERQDIQRWTQLILPPELVGGHVGPATAHSSGRTTDLSYRLATSLMGSAGLERNIAECTGEELATIAAWGALYKDVRHVIHAGAAVHADPLDPALRVTGFVAPDAAEGVYTIASVATLEDAVPERVRLYGLDPSRDYVVRVRTEIGEAKVGHGRTPAWMSDDAITLPGRVLETVGLQIPSLWPAQAIVLHLTARPAG